MAPRRGMMRRGPGAPTEKAKNFKGTLRELLKYMGVYKIALLFVLIFAVGSTVFTVVGPKILGNATTELFHGLMAKISGTGSIDFDKIGKILLGLIILYIVSALFGLIQGWLMTGISQKMCRKMRRDVGGKSIGCRWDILNRIWSAMCCRASPTMLIPWDSRSISRSPS